MRAPAIVAVLLLLFATHPAGAAGIVETDGIKIDVPVELKQARVVFNLDHLAFNGDEPIGLLFMRTMLEGFKADGTEWRIVAIFHGPNAYLALDDPLYNRVRHWMDGNPYKDQIAALQSAGVQIEICAETMRLNGWRNADLLPGIKVNTGANFRLIELIHQGFVEIQP
jgi:intracellular sulfur oxidation DsrE/DsrF family protein